jgi:hypothetical protein
MKTALVKRLKRLEEVRAVGSQPPLEFQIGYVKKLPEEFYSYRSAGAGHRSGAQVKGSSPSPVSTSKPN